MVKRLLHKKCHSATVDRIPSKYGVSIVQKWKHFVAIPIVGWQTALAVFDTCLRLRADNNIRLRSEPTLELYSRAASSVGITSPFQRSQHRKQFWRRLDPKKSRKSFSILKKNYFT